MKYCLLTLPLVLSACASQPVNAPSLLPRAIESRSESTPARDETVQDDPALNARIAQHVAAFDRAAAAFDSGVITLGRRIESGRGAAEGSERWLASQQAIGELQQLRTASEGAMADLEALAIARSGAGLLPYPALDAAIARAQTVIDWQTAEERRLLTRVS